MNNNIGTTTVTLQPFNKPKHRILNHIYLYIGFYTIKNKNKNHSGVVLLNVNPSIVLINTHNQWNVFDCQISSKKKMKLHSHPVHQST